jgi:hypothetical protein
MERLKRTFKTLLGGLWVPARAVQVVAHAGGGGEAEDERELGLLLGHC